MKTNIALTIAVFVILIGFIGCKSSPNAVTTAGNKAATANSAPPASGDDTVTIAESGITLTVPPGFTHEDDGGDILITSPDHGINITLSAADEADFESAREDGQEDLEDDITDVKTVEEDAAKKINGFDAGSSTGTGKTKADGKDVSWALTVIKTDKNPLLVEAYADKESLEKHSAEISALINSIKKN